MSATSPNIFDYLSYVEFLRARVAYLKRSEGLSERALAERGGLRSPSFLKMIADEKRRLTSKNLLAVAKALGLSERETAFLEGLMKFHDAKDLADKNAAYQELLEFKRFRDAKTLDHGAFEFFSHWSNVALFEALGCAHWQDHRRQTELCRALGLSDKQFHQSLALLERLHLVERDAKGSYRQKEFALETAPELQSLVVRNFHRQMILKAQQAVETLPQHRRDVGSLTIALSPENYAKVKEELYRFRSELNRKYAADISSREIYQLCFQLFPLLNAQEDVA